MKMNTDPHAAILAMALTRQQLQNTRPDAPVIPEAPNRPRRRATTRTRLADALRGLAQWVEPSRPRPTT